MQEVLLWLLITVVLAIVEMATMNLVTIWFAGGAFVAMIAAMFHLPIWVQLLVFAIVTTGLLVSTRSLVRKIVAQKTATNSDRVIGMCGIVTEPIDNLRETGAVKVDGKIWTAKALHQEAIPEGMIVEIREIRGVKVMVVPKDQETH